MYSSILLFLNIGGSEMVLIFAVALMLFGGKKLPELARGLGKGLREFKDASDGIKREIHNNINAVSEDIKSATEDVDVKKTDQQHTDTVSDTPDASDSNNPAFDKPDNGYSNNPDLDNAHTPDTDFSDNPDLQSMHAPDTGFSENPDLDNTDISASDDTGVSGDIETKQNKIAH